LVRSLRFRDTILLLRVPTVVVALLATLATLPPLVRAQTPDAPESLSLHASFEHYMRRYVQAATSGDT